ncbi:CNNM domain-containing protein [Tenacibaculum finnmarkense]|uniref:CNNM domain-containing protein n=1 Tax=Tenacibaculum finnmarkense TaxID=2781243 RepID=UPI000C51DAE2|nr:hemolysin family protein [Tenacibaculum finnmarkense]MCD8401518.1 hemolysin family protein [Tenacibaculum finnmarkense genomovar finnmarkense]MCD8438514.1 hemolysin family protein [Tenacibaculum finnmarkense genomovar ulcerans]MCD8446413.1 hemolysin family protein [Tenacibaculum finnmarkense genomovar finnmarkense]MCG8719448.1 HlyC/CorC family transporter [Tenacibaculum finnmarkense]WCC47040.1 hemolysin family protein [Tenacibaculum finnmarkense]
MTLLIIYATVSIFFSFICSILEAVLLSVTTTFINVKKKEGAAFATELETLKKDVDKPLIAILTLNTLAHTVGAILVGTEAKKIFNDDGYGVFIVSAVMTILILVASEIIPKTIGATYWKQLAGFTTTALKMMIFPLKWTGVLWILQLATKLIGGKSGHGESVLSREDFSVMTDIAQQEGVFHEDESNVIRNMLNFKDVQAKDIMTPRTVVVSADENQTIQSFFDKNKQLNFSRVPVFSKNSDNITGYILKDQLLLALIDKKGSQSLSSIKRDILVAKRELSVPDLFATLVKEREHLALVIDEYGSVSGLVTQEDVIETLLGFEIMDESDRVADLQNLARINWEKRSKNIDIIDHSDES